MGRDGGGWRHWRLPERRCTNRVTPGQRSACRGQAHADPEAGATTARERLREEPLGRVHSLPDPRLDE
jgi:hypothetical protein